MSKAYSSNLIRDQYKFLSDLIPPAKPGGRPRTVEMWQVLNAIFYVLVEGVRWRSLPGDFPAWQTVYTYFRDWRKDGTWLKIHDQLREWTRIEADRQPSPSEAIIDSQSVKSAAMVHQSVGYDAGKHIKGRKRFMTVDTLLTGVTGFGDRRQCARTGGRQTSAQTGQTDGSRGFSAPYDLGGWGL